MAKTRRPGLVLASASVVNALIWMPVSAIAVALPAIHDDLGSSFTGLQWMINGYTLAVAALLVLMGRIGDLFGRKRLFLIGCALFSGGALVAALAQSTTWLIAAMPVVGVGAAIAGPTSLALVVDAFPTRRQGWAIGIWGAASGLGSAIGPAVGGLLTQGINWRAVLWINVPLVLAALAVAARAARESREPGDQHHVDAPGALTLAGALTAGILALMQGAIWGWGSPGVIALLLAALILGTSFVVLDLRAQAPLVPLREFANRAFVGSSIVLLIGNLVLASLLFILPLYLQNITEHSPLEAGLLLLPLTATLMVLSPLSGVMTDRIGPRVPMMAGIVATAVGVYLLSDLHAGSSPAALVPGLLVLGVGFGLEITPVNVAALQSIPAIRRGTASGVLIALGMLGSTIGIAAFGAAFGALGRDRLPDRLEKAHVTVSPDEVSTLDTVLTGADSAEHALQGFSHTRAARIDRVVETTFVSALNDVLKVEALVALLALAGAALVPRRRATPVSTVPATGQPARGP
jgi:EmrB/QacA subfamily drug resistance transporter